ATSRAALRRGQPLCRRSALRLARAGGGSSRPGLRNFRGASRAPGGRRRRGSDPGDGDVPRHFESIGRGDPGEPRRRKRVSKRIGALLLFLVVAVVVAYQLLG